MVILVLDTKYDVTDTKHFYRHTSIKPFYRWKLLCNKSDLKRMVIQTSRVFYLVTMNGMNSLPLKLFHFHHSLLKKCKEGVKLCFDSIYCCSVLQLKHPTIHILYPYRCHGVARVTPTVGRRQGTPRTGHQSVAGLHNYRHSHMHTEGHFRVTN